MKAMRNNPNPKLARREEYRNGHSYGNGKEESLWGNATWKAQTMGYVAMWAGAVWLDVVLSILVV